MPSMIESPSGRVPEKASRWDLTRSETCGGRKVFPWLLLGFWNLCLFIGQGRRSGGQEVNEGATSPRGAPPGRPLACRLLEGLLTWTPSLVGVFWSKKNHRGSFIRFGLRLIFLFCETQKQGKTQTGTGSRLID